MLDVAHDRKVCILLFNKQKSGNYKKKEGTSLFDKISKKRNCYNQKVKYGCSCRVGNAKLDNDKYGSMYSTPNEYENVTAINIY